MQCDEMGNSYVSVAMNEAVVVTVAKGTGMVRVWDRVTREMLYQAAHHGGGRVRGMTTAGNVIVTVCPDCVQDPALGEGGVPGAWRGGR